MPLSNIQQRAITGTLLVITMVLGVQFHISLAILSILIFSFSMFELGRMFVVPIQINIAYTVVGTLVLFMLNFSKDFHLNDDYLNNLTKGEMIAKLATSVLLVSIISRNWLKNNQALWMLLGMIYIFIGCRTFYLVGSMEGFEQVRFLNKAILVLVTTWSNDVFAYLIGKKFGKHPLAPKISPKKTIEGTVGGLFFAGISATTYMYFENQKINYIYLLVGIIIGVAATIGDLIESKAKRMAGVKDSGNTLPGHGGFLDRFDAMFLTMPIYYLILYFI